MKVRTKAFFEGRKPGLLLIFVIFQAPGYGSAFPIQTAKSMRIRMHSTDFLHILPILRVGGTVVVLEVMVMLESVLLLLLMLMQPSCEGRNPSRHSHTPFRDLLFRATHTSWGPQNSGSSPTSQTETEN
jgi:hypothetical protein